MNKESQSKVPEPAAWIGAAGVIPFLAGTAGLWLLPPAAADDAAILLVGYGAVILSFMGAIYWGLAMGRDDQGSRSWYAISVLPALVGWLALMLAPALALTLLALAFIAVYAFDRAATATGVAPAWYRVLRTPLTAAVVALLLISLSAVLIRGT